MMLWQLIFETLQLFISCKTYFHEGLYCDSLLFLRIIVISYLHHCLHVFVFFSLFFTFVKFMFIVYVLLTTLLHFFTSQVHFVRICFATARTMAQGNLMFVDPLLTLLQLFACFTHVYTFIHFFTQKTPL